MSVVVQINFLNPAVREVREKLYGSVDMLDFGETVRIAGINLMTEGGEIMSLNEPPTEETLNSIYFAADRVIRAVKYYRQTRRDFR